jgi:hypothetical protein
MVSICSAVVLGALLSPPVAAQNNPFVRPQSSGLSKAQIEQLVRQQVEASVRQNRSTTSPSPVGPNGQPQARPDNLPQQQGGQPQANTASRAPQGGSSGSPSSADDPIANLLKDGGVFVGCVSGTPIFKDKIGRRAYFTTKELRESNEARRFARCG